MKQAVETLRVVAAATSLAAILVVGVILWRQRKRQRLQEIFEELKIPTKWKKVGEVSELIFYPLKGAKRQCITEAEFTTIGLREVLPTNSNKLSLQDRMFVVYNDKNDFINLKRTIKTLRIETSALDETKVKFSHPGVEDLIVEIPAHNNKINEVNFYHGEKVKAVDCGDEAASWFSHVVQDKPEGLRLGCFIQSLLPPRTIEGAFEKKKPLYPKLHSEYFGAFSDTASYMLMSEESLKDLNTRLERPVSEHNFRPNIMVKGCPAFSEDTWDWVRVGDDVVLRGFMCCTRCAVTTINPDTAERDSSYEPLRTLRLYRQLKDPVLRKLENNTPAMGLYLGCHRTGTVKVGDPVYLAEGH